MKKFTILLLCSPNQEIRPRWTQFGLRIKAEVHLSLLLSLLLLTSCQLPNLVSYVCFISLKSVTNSGLLGLRSSSVSIFIYLPYWNNLLASSLDPFSNLGQFSLSKMLAGPVITPSVASCCLRAIYKHLSMHDIKVLCLPFLLSPGGLTFTSSATYYDY